MKQFKEMTYQEQSSLMERISEFIAIDIPLLKKCGRVFSRDDEQRYFRGVALIEHFPQCRSFYLKASVIATGFDQYTTTLANQLRIITRYISTQAIVRDKGSVPSAQAPTHTAPKALDPQTSKVSAKATIKSTPSPIEPRPPELRSLKSWAWIMPAPLAADVSIVKDLRAEIASHSERAKQMLLEGAREEEIRYYTTKAKELNRRLEQIFARTDRHLAIAYIMLTQVNKDYGKWAERYASSGGYSVLVAELKPYYEKLSAKGQGVEQDLLVEARKMASGRMARREESKGENTADDEREKERHAIRTYFARRDLKPTPTRLAALRERYNRALELEMDHDSLEAFKVIIAKVESELKTAQGYGR